MGLALFQVLVISPLPFLPNTRFQTYSIIFNITDILNNHNQTKKKKKKKKIRSIEVFKLHLITFYPTQSS